MSSCGIVNTIQSPTLTGVSQPELIKFEVDNATCKERVEDVNTSRPQNQQIKAVSVRKCLKPKLLHSLCILDRIEEAATAEEATDDTVKSWFDARLTSTSWDLSDRVEEALYTVKHKPTPRDPSGAADNLVLKIIATLGEHNASSIITDIDQCKELIAKLVRKLKPRELRQIVTDQMRLWKKEQKRNLKFFTNTISTLAAQVHIVQCSSSKLKRKSTHLRQSASPSGKSDEPERKKACGDSRPHTSRSNGKDAKKKNPTENFESEEWDKPCLNSEECSGVHPISKCPVTTKEKRSELLEKHFGRGRGNKKSAKGAVLRSSPCLSPNANEGRYRIRLNGVKAVALGDSGADNSRIPYDFYEKISAKYPRLNTERLQTPVALETALETEGTQPSTTATRKVNLDLTILLPQTEFPVRSEEYSSLSRTPRCQKFFSGGPS